MHEEVGVGIAKLVDEVAVQADVTKKAARAAIDALTAFILVETRAGNKVHVPGFGLFYRYDRGPKVGRNPRTGERMTIAPRSMVKFKPARHTFFAS